MRDVRATSGLRARMTDRVTERSICLATACYAEALPDCPVALCQPHADAVFAYVLPEVERRIDAQLVQRATIQARAGVLSDANGHVYFIRKDALIKIGWTANLTQRMRALKPDAVLHTQPGTMREERRCHAAFAHLRDHGEFFRPEPDLLAFIADLGGEVPADWHDLTDHWTAA